MTNLLLVLVLLTLLCISYFCAFVVEYRNCFYQIEFIKDDDAFGKISHGKKYYCWRNAHYRYWKRTEVFHFIDDDGVSRFINIYDPILRKCKFGVTREV